MMNSWLKGIAVLAIAFVSFMIGWFHCGFHIFSEFGNVEKTARHEVAKFALENCSTHEETQIYLRWVIASNESVTTKTKAR